MTDVNVSFDVTILRTGTRIWTWRLRRDEQVLAEGTASSPDLACESVGLIATAITDAAHSSGNGHTIVHSGYEPSQYDWKLTIVNGFRNWERI